MVVETCLTSTAAGRYSNIKNAFLIFSFVDAKIALRFTLMAESITDGDVGSFRLKLQLGDVIAVSSDDLLLIIE